MDRTVPSHFPVSFVFRVVILMTAVGVSIPLIARAGLPSAEQPASPASAKVPPPKALQIIRGRVTLSDGTPLPGVTVESKAADDLYSMSPTRVQTCEDGRFWISCPDGKAQKVVCHLAGFRRTRDRVRPGARNVDFVVAGRVVRVHCRSDRHGRHPRGQDGEADGDGPEVRGRS